MEEQIERIREQQKESWNKFSPGWEKWDELFMSFLRPMGDEMIRQLNLRKTDVVLDVASGTGEPGLSIAAKVEEGSVILTDLSHNMLDIANKNASRRNIGNIKTMACDVTALPFADNTFDAISCRLGFMFFPDMKQAAKEMRRVLKPGGRISTSVWGLPSKNFWVTAMMGTINANLDLVPLPQGAPGVFRCADDNLMKDLLLHAGFKNIFQKEIEANLQLKSMDAYWNLMTEVAAPVVEALGNATHTLKEKIRSEVYATVKKKCPGGHVSLGSSSLVICGEK